MSRISVFCTVLCALALCCTPAFPATAAIDPPRAAGQAAAPNAPLPASEEKITAEDVRRAAVAQARKGNYQEALAALKRLHEAHRDDSAILYDYIVVTCWGGQYAAAVALCSGLAPERVPEYVLQAAAAAWRKCGKLAEAQHWYDVGAARFPGNADIALGRALTLGDQGHAAQGLKALTAYSRKFPDADARAVASGKAYLRRQIVPLQPYVTPPRPERPYRAEQDAAVAEARQGKVAEGLAVMEKLCRQHPDDQWLLGDYLFLLQWNKEDDKAVALCSRLRLDSAPPYALEAGARALATAGKIYDCEALLEKALAAQRRNPELLVAAASVFAGVGDVYEAALLLDEAERSRTPGLEGRITAVRNSMGYGRIMAMKDLRAAAGAGARGGSRDTRAGVARDLSAAGAAQEARGVVTRPEGRGLPPVSSERFNAFTRASALEDAYWGEQASIPRNLGERERRLHASLSLLDGLGEGPECPPQSDCLLQRDIARIQPLADLGRAPEAVTQYEAVKGRVPMLPPSAQLAAANAYVQLREPEKARDIYAAIVADRDKYAPPLKPDDLYRAQNGLFWAYLENEQLAEALRQAKSTWESGLRPTGGQPPWEDTDWKKLDADTTLGYAYLYTNAYGKAETHFSGLAAQAPAAGDAQSGLAATYLMRGLPRAALETVNQARIFSPDDINLAAHRANALMDVKDWRAARGIIGELKDYAPYSSEIRLLQRRWETHSLYELRLEGNWSSPFGNTSPGTGSRTQTSSLEWRLYSPPLDYDWRVYGGTAFARGRYDEGLARQFLSLMGVEYRVPWVTASLEARNDDSGSNDMGAALYGALTPGDHWSFPFSFEIGSRDTPLRARNEGITADSYGMGAEYRWNESRSARVRAQGMSFSDGNQRVGLDAAFTQRLWQELTRHVDGTIGVYAGGNSRDEDRPYFNPKAEAEMSGTLSYGALLWRRYDRAWRHAASVQAGGYAQQSYGTRPFFSLNYSQSLDWTDRFSVTYGAGFERRPYDDDLESDINLFVNLNWKF